MVTFEEIFKKVKVTPLSAEEKAKSREQLSAFMALMPVRSAQLAGASADFPFEKRTWFSLGRATSVASLVGVLLVSASGVSYAAAGSLPGDRLYRMKVGVNEGVRSAITMSHQKMAELEAERAERRLTEAE